MTDEGIFPVRADEMERGIVALSRRLSCDYDLVQTCFGSLDIAWATPKHLREVDETTHHFNRAAQLARQLHREMARMSVGQRNDLAVYGAVTLYQVEHLADVLAADATSLRDWSRTKIRTGGRNNSAHNVAELVRRLFRRLRKKITYGADDKGFPSTEFGKTVEFALGEFGIKANWRSPTREAVDRQHAYQARINDCAIRAFRAQGERSAG